VRLGDRLTWGSSPSPWSITVMLVLVSIDILGSSSGFCRDPEMMGTADDRTATG
jgi:hypothetical protein